MELMGYPKKKDFQEASDKIVVATRVVQEITVTAKVIRLIKRGRKVEQSE